jgi:hypothetical protein
MTLNKLADRVEQATKEMLELAKFLRRDAFETLADRDYNSDWWAGARHARTGTVTKCLDDLDLADRLEARALAQQEKDRG